jgi:hypothetical protein
VKTLRTISFIIFCICSILVAPAVLKADLCEDPAVFTGVSDESGEWAEWNCDNDYTGWQEACEWTCGDGYRDASATASCSAPQVCGYQSEPPYAPIYCSSVVLQCQNEPI